MYFYLKHQHVGPNLKRVASCLMRLTFVFNLILISSCGISQFNSRSANVTLLGFGKKYSQIFYFLGYTSLSNGQNSQDEGPPRYYGEEAGGLSMDFRHLNFTENSVISVSGESALYTLGELFSSRREPYKGAFNFLVGQPTDGLSHNKYQGMKEYHTRWINIRYVEGNFTFGPWDLQLGLHTSVRSLGRTDFKSFTNEYNRVFATGELVTKLLAGPAIGFRKTIDNVNILAFGSISGSLNMKNSYKLKNSNHIEISLFIGKKAGIFASAYMRTYECESFQYQGELIAPNFVEYTIHGGLFFCTGQ